MISILNTRINFLKTKYEFVDMAVPFMYRHLSVEEYPHMGIHFKDRQYNVEILCPVETTDFMNPDWYMIDDCEDKLYTRLENKFKILKTEILRMIDLFQKKHTEENINNKYNKWAAKYRHHPREQEKKIVLQNIEDFIILPVLPSEQIIEEPNKKNDNQNIYMKKLPDAPLNLNDLTKSIEIHSPIQKMKIIKTKKDNTNIFLFGIAVLLGLIFFFGFY
jgi:hypothetical protein